MISNKGLNKLAKIAQEIGGTSGIDSTGEMATQAQELMSWASGIQETLDDMMSTMKQMSKDTNEVASIAHTLVQRLADPEGLEEPYESVEMLDEQLESALALKESVMSSFKIL